MNASVDGERSSTVQVGPRAQVDPVEGTGAAGTQRSGTAVRLSTRPLVVVLGAVTAALLVINLAAKLVTPFEERGDSWVLGHFDVNHETNAPTMWNGALLVAVALACVAVAALLTSGRLRWLAAATAATGMAADETLRVHERLGAVGARLSDGTGIEIPTYAWVLPGAVLALGLAAALVLWVRALPADVRWGVLGGGAMYIAGALGAEAVSGWIHQGQGITVAYAVVTTVEEGLEMFGCIVVLAAVLRMVVVAVDGHGRRWAGLRASDG